MNTGPWPWYIGFTTEEEAFQREMKRLRVKDAGPGVKAGSNAATHHLVNGKLAYHALNSRTTAPPAATGETISGEMIRLRPRLSQTQADEDFSPWQIHFNKEERVAFDDVFEGFAGRPGHLQAVQNYSSTT
jgi:hypothetical protein